MPAWREVLLRAVALHLCMKSANNDANNERNPERSEEDAMRELTIRDRAAGAVMGAVIGDAMGLGPHWYYDLNELRRDYGPWITDYTDPKPGRYHAGLKAGQLSQAGFIYTMLLESLG